MRLMELRIDFLSKRRFWQAVTRWRSWLNRANKSSSSTTALGAKLNILEWDDFLLRRRVRQRVRLNLQLRCTIDWLGLEVLQGLFVRLLLQLECCRNGCLGLISTFLWRETFIYAANFMF